MAADCKKTPKGFTELFFFLCMTVGLGGLLGVLELFFRTHGKMWVGIETKKWKDLKGPRALQAEKIHHDKTMEKKQMWSPVVSKDWNKEW